MYPKISIIVPSFKAGNTLERTLLSLISQNYPCLQIIVCDGGSRDGTVEILQRYDDQIDFWVSEPDEGQVDALNKGFKRANGEYFGWLCADDEITPGALVKLIHTFNQYPEADIVTGGCIRDFNGEHQITTTPVDDFFEKLAITNTIEQPSTLWRRTAHLAAGALDDSYKYAFDWEFWCRMKRNGAVFRKINDPLSVYYFSDDNLTSTGGTKIADEMYRIVKAYGPYNGRIADAYRFLYRHFDLKGFYDKEQTGQRKKWQDKIFHIVLRIMYIWYDADSVNAYNWNFASRQERGLGW